MSKTEFETAAPWVPPAATLPDLIRASRKCQGCDLFRNATQTVFGAGPEKAGVVLIGEQPGDKEDIEGKPFVGPAGKLLDRALEEAGIDRDLVYVTNAVKHFKNEPRGKRRIHKKPNAAEITACRPWLEAELDVIRPGVIVCLGATAAQAMLGRTFKITEERGLVKAHARGQIVTTVHPSSLLRIPEPERRHEEFAHFVADLKVASEAIRKSTSAGRRSVP